ncbi:unnamed protein product [Onchocerca flexuosa]|uniref:Transthyretin-like family protein n=1 Tax=Onchocerca flexuosa TaxID=387005 RepID=A0A183HV57_9BILA|nr:unnamed protein product [Onchocerca flexuosa]
MIFCYIFLLLGIDVFSVNADVIETLQDITVIGKLTCGTKPISGVQLQIWEKDPGNDPDDLINTAFSDAKGAFRIYGQEIEATTIEPYLVTKHNCHNGAINPNCTVIDEYTIPKEFVGKTYNMHTINLSTAGMSHIEKCE